MQIEIEGNRAILKTKPNPKILALCRKFEGHRSWLKAGGLSIEASEFNLAAIREAYPGIVKENRRATEAPEGFEPSERGSYVMKTDPMPHQIPGLPKMRSVDHFALFMEQGTGKTWMAIDRAGDLYAQGVITGMLVFSKKGVHRQWVEEQFPKHAGFDYIARHWPVKELPKELRPGIGLKVFTINIDAIKSDRAFKICAEFIDAHRGKILCAIDESQTIKNASSSRSKAAHILGKFCIRRLILSGTPIAKELTDEWAQLKWLDDRILGMRYISSFKNEFCIMGGFEGREIVSYRNMDRFRELTDPYCYRVTSEDAGVRPPIYNQFVFDMTKEQKRLIRELKNEFVAQVESGIEITASHKAIVALKIQQISNGFFNDENGSPRPLMASSDNPRIEALFDLIEDIGRDEKVIIWTRFREDVNILRNAFQAKRFVVYEGSDKARDEAVKSFLSADGAQYFIANPASGGTGLNLQGLCRNDIFYSNSDNAIDRWQAEARINRIGTPGIVVHHDLIGKGGIDRAILGRHAKKERLSEMAIGDFVKALEEI